MKKIFTYIQICIFCFSISKVHSLTINITPQLLQKKPDSFFFEKETETIGLYFNNNNCQKGDQESCLKSILSDPDSHTYLIVFNNNFCDEKDCTFLFNSFNDGITDLDRFIVAEKLSQVYDECSANKMNDLDLYFSKKTISKNCEFVEANEVIHSLTSKNDGNHTWLVENRNRINHIYGVNPYSSIGSEPQSGGGLTGIVAASLFLLAYLWYNVLCPSLADTKEEFDNCSKGMSGEPSR